MKKTLLTCLALAVTALMLFISCNAEVKAPVDTDGLAYVTFGDNTRSASFSVTYDIEEYEDLYWTYTATKTDGGGVTGQTDGETYLGGLDTDGKPNKGINYTIGGFSAGEWEFTLTAYKELVENKDKDNSTTYSIDTNSKVYETDGEITATLRNGETKSVAAKVTYAADMPGSIRFGSLGGDDGTTNQNDAYFGWTKSGSKTKAPCFRIDAYGVTAKKTYVFTNDDKVEKTDEIEAVYKLVLEKDTSGTSSTKYIIRFVKSTSDGETENVDTITNMPADYYSCTVSAYTYGSDDETKTNVAENFTFAFRVYGSATTEITGNLTEDAQSKWKFNVSKIEVKSFTKSDEGETEVKSNNGATAVFSAGDLDDSASYVFSRNDQDADSSSEKFVVMTKNDDSAGTDQVAVYGSSSFSLEEIKGNSSKSIDKFSTPVKATIPVAKNLDSNNIAVYYSADGKTIDYSTDYYKSYDSGNGLVEIETSHFSTFVVAGKTAAPIYNVTQRRYYSTLQDAVANLEGTSELKLNTDCTVTTDFIELNTKLILDLNGKTITANTVTEDLGGSKAFGLFCLKSNSSLTIKNGNITTERKTKADWNFQTLKVGQNADNVSLTVENVKITAPNGVIISAGVSNIDVTVRDSEIYYSTWGYGIGTNAKEPSEKGNVNIKIEDTFIGPRKGIADTEENCYTGLLLNVPTTVTVTDSEIHGGRQAAIFRGGTYTVSNSTFEYTTDSDEDHKKYESENWGSGNAVPNAAIVIGNRSGSYAYPTSVTFIGENTLTVPTEESNQLYIWQNSKEYSVTVIGFDESWSVNDDFNGAAVKSADEKTWYVNDANSFERAISDVEDYSAVKLLGNISCNTAKIAERNNLTIDFNGNKIIGSIGIESCEGVALKDSGNSAIGGLDGTVNIEDSDVTVESGKYSSSGADNFTTWNSDLTICAGTFTNSSGNIVKVQYTYPEWDEDSSIKIKNGDFTASGYWAYIISTETPSTNENGLRVGKVSVEIDGGRFKTTGSRSHIIQGYFGEDGVIINDGTFEVNGDSAFLTDVYGKVTVNNCKLESNGEAVFYPETSTGEWTEKNNISVKSGVFKMNGNSTKEFIQKFVYNKGMLELESGKVNWSVDTGILEDTGCSLSAVDTEGYYTISKSTT